MTHCFRLRWTSTAFIDAAAKPLRHNLNAALQVLDGKGFADAAKDEMIPDLWSSLFLVVPAMSTTFASVGTMLGRVPPDALGWLLVDEAGQAAPQQGVGAIMRVNRAIVVGDPIQVQPVVLLPGRLTAAICHTFGARAKEAVYVIGNRSLWCSAGVFGNLHALLK